MATNCTCCNRKLNPATLVGLELDQRVGEYHNFGGVPESESQGFFDFGVACAKKANAKAKAALEAKGLFDATPVGQSVKTLARSRYCTPAETYLAEALQNVINEFGGKNPANLDPAISGHKVLLDAIAVLKAVKS